MNTNQITRRIVETMDGETFLHFVLTHDGRLSLGFDDVLRKFLLLRRGLFDDQPAVISSGANLEELKQTVLRLSSEELDEILSQVFLSRDEVRQEAEDLSDFGESYAADLDEVEELTEEERERRQDNQIYDDDSYSRGTSKKLQWPD